MSVVSVHHAVFLSDLVLGQRSRPLDSEVLDSGREDGHIEDGDVTTDDPLLLMP